MAQGMWQKIEITGLSLGLLTVAVLLTKIFFWKYIPDEIHQYFYGGEPGGVRNWCINSCWSIKLSLIYNQPIF